MPKLLSAKGGKLTLGDAMLIAGAKTIEERLMSRVVGNGTLFSGGVKIVLGIGANKIVGGKIGDIAGTAFMVDGAEDLVLALVGGQAQTQLFGGGGTTQSGGVEVI